MKEAAGEANMTVITIVLIALVLAVGTPLVKSLLNSTAKSSCCNSYGGVWEKGQCTNSDTGALIDAGDYWDSKKQKCKEY